MRRIIGKDISEKVKKHIKYLLIILILIDIIFSSSYVYKRMNDKLWADNKFINIAVTNELKEYHKLLQALTIARQKNHINNKVEGLCEWTEIYKENFHILDIAIIDENNNEFIECNSLLPIAIDTIANKKNWGITEVKLTADNKHYVYAMWNKVKRNLGKSETLVFILPFESIQNTLRSYYKEEDSYSLIIQESSKIVAHSYSNDYLNSNAQNHGEKIIGYSQEEFERRYKNGEIIPFLSYSKSRGVFYWNVYSSIEDTNWMLLSRVNLNSYLLILGLLFILKMIIFFFVTKRIIRLLTEKIHKNTSCVDLMLNQSNGIICPDSSEENIDKLLKYSVDSMIDKQTGALRREVFLLKVQEKIHTTQFQSYLFFVDLDNLKQINDYLGHDSGDFIINLFCKKIRSFFHKQEILIGRFGGDEFLVYIHDCQKLEMQKLMQEINDNLRGRRKGIVYSASIGISIYPEHSRDLSELVNFADQALYQAKEAGKNTYRIYSK